METTKREFTEACMESLLTTGPSRVYKFFAENEWALRQLSRCDACNELDEFLKRTAPKFKEWAERSGTKQPGAADHYMNTVQSFVAMHFMMNPPYCKTLIRRKEDGSYSAIWCRMETNDLQMMRDGMLSCTVSEGGPAVIRVVKYVNGEHEEVTDDMLKAAHSDCASAGIIPGKADAKDGHGRTKPDILLAVLGRIEPPHYRFDGEVQARACVVCLESIRYSIEALCNAIGRLIDADRIKGIEPADPDSGDMGRGFRIIRAVEDEFAGEENSEMYVSMEPVCDRQAGGFRVRKFQIEVRTK